MTSQHPDPSASNQHLDEVVTAYLKALEAGAPPDQQAWLKRFPELAQELAAFFAGQRQVEQLAGQLHPTIAPANAAQEAPTLVPGEPLASPSLGKVRYFGDYELLNEIARGGMGVVYRARQASLNRIVALKMILAGQLASPEDVARFHREAEAAANLDHPNIVPIYEVGEHEGQHYFSMKLVEGGSLAERVAREEGRGASRDGQKAAAGMVATIARAVHHAASRGILHRDLKPSNILLDPQSQPYVTDFGLAKQVKSDLRQTRSGSFVGTPSYMPPEQARSEKVLTTAVDVYSLGAVLYELLTGRPPFRANTALDTIMQVLDREPDRPRKLKPTIDRDLETVCLHCLEKDPGQALQLGSELAEDLKRWQAGEPILARSSSRPEQIIESARRKPALAGLVGVSAVAVVILALGSLFYVAQLKEFNDGLQGALHETKKERDEADTQRQHPRSRAACLATRIDHGRNLYSAHMNLAQRAWEMDNVVRVLDLLNAHRPESGRVDQRGFEWYFLWRQCHSDRWTIPDHQQVVTSVAFSPDGKLLDPRVGT